MVNGIKKTAERIYLILILLLLYIPIALLIVSSFNASERNKAIWGGFTFKAYTELVQDEIVMSALGRTRAPRPGRDHRHGGSRRCGGQPGLCRDDGAGGDLH